MLLCVSPFCIGPNSASYRSSHVDLPPDFLGQRACSGFSSALFNADDAFALPESGHSSAEAPHDAYEFWNGFFDSVNTGSPDYKRAHAQARQVWRIPGAETQYLHYKADAKQLRYATEISQNELLDHDGDVAVGIQLSNFRNGIGQRQDKKSAVAHRRHPDHTLHEPSRAPCLDGDCFS